MVVWFYVKTADNPKSVGETVCNYNIFQDEHPKGKYSWAMEQIKGEEDSWQIISKYEGLKSTEFVALFYRAGDTVVFGEVNDRFIPNFMDPLLERYGFDNVKFIVTSPSK